MRSSQDRKKKLDNESTHNGSVQTCTEYKNSISLELIVDGLSMDSYLIETQCAQAENLIPTYSQGSTLTSI